MCESHSLYQGKVRINTKDDTDYPLNDYVLELIWIRLRVRVNFNS